MYWEWLFFGFHHDGSLCHHVVTRIRISNSTSKNDIIFIESCELSRVSRYGTGITVTYFDHNNEYRLEIVGRISSCDLVIYVFIVPMKRKVPVLFHLPKDKRWFSNFRDDLKLGCYIPFIYGHIIESRIWFHWKVLKFKT